MAKRFATDTGFRVANEALQLHGGCGYLAEHGMRRRAETCVIASLLADGIRHAEAAVTAQRIEAVAPGAGQATVEVELEEGRKREAELRAQLDRPQRQLRGAVL